TDHAAEALMGFFTKFGDGAADVTPLTGLNKRRVRALAQAMGAPDEQVNKVPTADLESLSPLKPDEVAMGVSYTEIDAFLEGRGGVGGRPQACRGCRPRGGAADGREGRGVVGGLAGSVGSVTTGCSPVRVCRKAVMAFTSSSFSSVPS